MDFVLVDKKTTFIEKGSKIGKNVIIYENNRIEAGSVIEDNVTIFPNCYISNSIIGKGSKIYSSVIKNSKIGRCAFIEPFVYLNGCEAGEKCKIKSFSRLKKEKIGFESAIEWKKTWQFVFFYWNWNNKVISYMYIIRK